MNNQERYEDAVHRLHACDYEVTPDKQGFIVHQLTDHNDLSHAYNLSQLIDFADLIEWAKQRSAS